MAKGGKREGAGRPAGVPNKVTAEVKALAQTYGQEAIAELARIMTNSESDQARIAAIRELLDRGYGKALQGVELSAPGGGPLQYEKVVREIVDPANKDA